MVREDLHWVPSALKVVAPVTTGHDNSEHLLIAYGVVPLRRRHAPRPKGNRVPVAFAGKFLTVHAMRGGCRAADIILLLREDASHGEAQGIGLKTDWPGRIKVS